MQVYQHLPEIKLIVATVLHTIIYYSKTIQHFNILSYERETVLPEMQEGKSIVGFITSNHLGIGLLHHTISLIPKALVLRNFLWFYLFW